MFKTDTLAAAAAAVGYLVNISQQWWALAIIGESKRVVNYAVVVGSFHVNGYKRDFVFIDFSSNHAKHECLSIVGSIDRAIYFLCI